MGLYAAGEFGSFPGFGNRTSLDTFQQLVTVLSRRHLLNNSTISSSSTGSAIDITLPRIPSGPGAVFFADILLLPRLVRLMLSAWGGRLLSGCESPLVVVQGHVERECP